MALLISLLPAGLFILLVFWAVRGLYRYLFCNQILNRLERRAKDTDELAIAEAIRAKDYAAFEHLIKITWHSHSPWQAGSALHAKPSSASAVD